MSGRCAWHMAVAALTVVLAIGSGSVQAEPTIRSGENPLDRVRVGDTRADSAGGLHFVPNVGQFDPVVRFQLRGAGGIWWFTDDVIWLTVMRGEPGSRTRPTVSDADLNASPEPAGIRGVNLRLTFAGMSPSAQWSPGQPLPGRTNYLRGADPTRWQTNVPAYGTLSWRSLYPGLDLVITATGLRLDAGPGADVSAVRLMVEGADGVRAGEQQNLIADTSIGPVSLPVFLSGDGARLAPRIGPSGTTFALSPAFHGLRDPNIRFGLSATTPLTDSADLLYSTYLGGSGMDFAEAVALDSSGAAYITGGSASGDFPITPGAFDGGMEGPFDAFVTKLSPTGNGQNDLVYSTFLGGGGYDYGHAIAIAGTGEAVVTGDGGDVFPTTPGAYDPTPNGSGDAFLARLNAAGTGLVFSTLLGGYGIDGGYGLALFPDGRATVSGVAQSPNFPSTPGAYDRTCGTDGGCNGRLDGFVAQFSADGSRLLYSTFLGGSRSDVAHSLALGSDGSTYVTGYTQSGDFPVTPGAFDTTCDLCPHFAMFITRLNPPGSGLVFSSFLGPAACGYDGDTCRIAAGRDGTAYVLGTTTNASFPTTPGAYDRTLGGPEDAIVARLTADGTSLLFSTFLGGGNWECAYDCAFQVASDGSLVVAGEGSADFPTTPGAFDTVNSGYYSQPFAARLNAQGSALLYSTFFGGGGCGMQYCRGDAIDGLAVDSAGIVYLVGHTGSDDFPTTPGAYDASYNGGPDYYDAFFAKLNTYEQDVHVAGISLAQRPYQGRRLIYELVTVKDPIGAPVSGVNLTVRVTGPSGGTVEQTGLTGSGGRVRLRMVAGQPGSYTFTVTNLAKDGWSYRPDENLETSDTITIP